MAYIPSAIAEFLESKRIAVAGASRDSHQPANLIMRRLRETGHTVIPINPQAAEIDGEPCYPDLRSVPGPLDAVMVVTHPAVSADVARQATERGIPRVWFHRAFGDGSVSSDAVAECRAKGVTPIVGGCPLMYCGSVDFGHKCFRWWLGWRGRVPQ